MCRRTEARDTEAKSPSVHRFHLRDFWKCLPKAVPGEPLNRELMDELFER